MPSNKAILRDIHELGLDPTKAYAKTDRHGRIHDHHKQANAKYAVAEQAPVKNALKEFAPEPKAEIPVKVSPAVEKLTVETVPVIAEVPAAEQAVVDDIQAEIVEDEAVTEDAQPTKKFGKNKKNDKA